MKRINGHVKWYQFLVLTSFLALTSITLITPIFEDNFNTDASGWSLSTDGGGNAWKWFSDQGEDGTGGLRCKILPVNNYVISPAFSVTGNTEYSLVFSAAKAASNSQRIIHTAYSSNPILDLDTTQIGTATIPNHSGSSPNWATYVLPFTPSANGDIHLVFTGEGSGFRFLYLDNIIVEPRVNPTISWQQPNDGAAFTEGDDVTLSVNTSDADGAIDRVEYRSNGQLIGTVTSTPFDFVWTDVLPGSYQLEATTYDNRGYNATTNIHSISVTQATGSNDVSTYDFDTQSEYWTYYGGWDTRDFGINGSVAAWGFNLIEDDYLASPGIALQTGEPYTLEFRVDAQGSNRELTAAIHTTTSLGGTDLLTIAIDADEDFQTLHTVNFTVPTNGLHHLIFYCSAGTGFRKIIIDDVTLRGSHNQGALSTLNYNPLASTTIVEGAPFTFEVDAVDNDGQISQVEFQVDEQTVSMDNTLPYSGLWPNASAGPHQMRALVTDNEGLAYPSFPLAIEVEPNTLTSSFLGGNGDDEVRGSIVQPDGTIVLAANLNSLPSGVTPILLNGATNNSPGTILRLSSDGTTILSATKIADQVVDLARDNSGRLFVAAGPDGLFCLNNFAQQIIYSHTFTDNVHRVDAGANGFAVVLVDDESDYDEIKLLNASLHLYNANGTEIDVSPGATTFTTDVCIDAISQTVVSIGYKNVFTNDGTGAVLPVDIPAMVGRDFEGNEKFRAYDWSDDDNSPRWLNLPENNMADTRGARCAIGLDGKLYAVFEADGGNHCLRYSPFSITTPNPIVGGDAYSEFYNSNTEPKAVVLRFEPGTGLALRTQQFCARLSNTAANTVRTKNGNIAANSAGEVFLVGQSASGIPINLEHLPGTYLGGAYLLKLSDDFSERELCIRLTNGTTHSVAVDNDGGYVFAGSTENNMYLSNPLQTSAGSGRAAWFGVEPVQPFSVQVVLPVSWTLFTAEAQADFSSVLNWETGVEENNAGFWVERSQNGRNWIKVSERISPHPSQQYEFIDRYELRSGIYYYRIQQTDLDGKSDFSPIRTVTFHDTEEQVLIFPNPTTKVLNVVLTEIKDKSIEWSLYDEDGRQIQTGGKTIEATDLSWTINMEGLPTGIYQLVIQSENATIYRKVVKN